MQFTKPGALERGESYFITGKGSIGMAMRAKTPIFDNEGNVIGVVSIGYLVSKIDSWRLDFITDGGVFVLLLVVLMLLSGFSPRISADKCWAWSRNRLRAWYASRRRYLARFMKG